MRDCSASSKDTQLHADHPNVTLLLDISDSPHRLSTRLFILRKERPNQGSMLCPVEACEAQRSSLNGGRSKSSLSSSHQQPPHPLSTQHCHAANAQHCNWCMVKFHQPRSSAQARSALQTLRRIVENAEGPAEQCRRDSGGAHLQKAEDEGLEVN